MRVSSILIASLSLFALTSATLVKAPHGHSHLKNRQNSIVVPVKFINSVTQKSPTLNGNSQDLNFFNRATTPVKVVNSVTHKSPDLNGNNENLNFFNRAAESDDQRLIEDLKKFVKILNAAIDEIEKMGSSKVSTPKSISPQNKPFQSQFGTEICLSYSVSSGPNIYLCLAQNFWSGP